MTYHELVSKMLQILFTGKNKFHCILPTEMKNVYVPYRFEKSEEEFFLDLTTKKQARFFIFRQKNSMHLQPCTYFSFVEIQTKYTCQKNLY